MKCFNHQCNVWYSNEWNFLVNPNIKFHFDDKIWQFSLFLWAQKLNIGVCSFSSQKYPWCDLICLTTTCLVSNHAFDKSCVFRTSQRDRAPSFVIMYVWSMSVWKWCFSVGQQSNFNPISFLWKNDTIRLKRYFT